MKIPHRDKLETDLCSNITYINLLPVVPNRTRNVRLDDRHRDGKLSDTEEILNDLGRSIGLTGSIIDWLTKVVNEISWSREKVNWGKKIHDPLYFFILWSRRNATLHPLRLPSSPTPVLVLYYVNFPNFVCSSSRSLCFLFFTRTYPTTPRKP